MFRGDVLRVTLDYNSSLCICWNIGVLIRSCLIILMLYKDILQIKYAFSLTYSS